ncbi:MAG: hypothetical protein M3N16_05110 [Actinomycetota bacterium]|nr:hypothetical protein [Actinomycetota bacterium]
MGRLAKFALGLATLWPPLYIVFFFVVVATASIRGGGEPDEHLLVPEVVLLGLHLFTFVLIIVLLVIYLVHAYRTDRIPESRRTFWAVALFMGSIVSMPLYWWLYIRRDEAGSGPTAPRE